jgi:hypothetical protein
MGKHLVERAGKDTHVMQEEALGGRRHPVLTDRRE